MAAVELTDDELATVRVLTTQRLEAEAAAKADSELQASLHVPLDESREKTLAAFAQMGITIGQKRHCWLRLRRHNWWYSRRFLRRHDLNGYSASYSVGTRGDHIGYLICFDCGHEREWYRSSACVLPMPM